MKLTRKIKRFWQWLLKHFQTIVRVLVAIITLVALVEHIHDIHEAGECMDSTFILDTMLRGLEAMMNGTSPCL